VSTCVCSVTLAVRGGPWSNASHAPCTPWRAAQGKRAEGMRVDGADHTITSVVERVCTERVSKHGHCRVSPADLDQEELIPEGRSTFCWVCSLEG
jgi:hypothetical protein